MSGSGVRFAFGCQQQAILWLPVNQAAQGLIDQVEWNP